MVPAVVRRTELTALVVGFVIASVVVVYGAYGDPHASSRQESAVPLFLGVVAVISLGVHWKAVPLLVGNAWAGGSRAGLVVLMVVTLLSLVAFWSGVPIVLGAACFAVGYCASMVSADGRQVDRSAAWARIVGAIAVVVPVVVTVVGNALHK